MTKIYEQHDKAFKQVSAKAILRDGVHVANISIKFPIDGAGRFYAYFHLIGSEMCRGFAGGYGYDKTTACVYDAITKTEIADDHYSNTPKQLEMLAMFKAAISDNDGYDWQRLLRDAGFTVLNVV